MIRRGLIAVAVILGVLVILALGLWQFSSRLDAGPLVAERVSDALGRPVQIGALHVRLGRRITLDLHDLRIGNVPGGSKPSMIELAHATAQLDAISLIAGRLVICRASIDGLSMLLEKPHGQRANWSFEPPRSKPKQPGHASPPTLLHLDLANADIVYRMQGGVALPTHLTRLSIDTTGTDQPVRLAASGTYGRVPLSLEADLQSITALRRVPAPYGVDLRTASNEVRLRFQGTMTDPLDVDGAKGTLSFEAPRPGPLLALVGITRSQQTPILLSGPFERSGDVWALTNGNGAIAGNRIATASLRFTEGGKGKPDDVAIRIAFDKLDLNALLAKAGGGNNADIPLAVEASPDPLIDARLSVSGLLYDTYALSGVTLVAAVTPGQIKIGELSLTVLGIHATASGQVQAAGSRQSANLAVLGADIQRIRATLGLGRLPLAGQLNAKLAVSSTGPTLNTAVKNARVAAVLWMKGGNIDKNVIELASTDVRRLFRKSNATSPLSCLLGALDMQSGAGSLVPLRINSPDGTIAGHATFDLNRRRFDLTIASRSASTGFFALDIPMRVSGTFANPTVRPARWTKAGRALLASAGDLLALPPDLQKTARSSACFPSH